MLHNDGATYYNTSISTLSMSELNVVMVYGIGAFILVVIPVVVIALYEMKQIKQSQHSQMDSIPAGIMKTYIYSVLFLFIVMLILMAIIGASNNIINPAFGIDVFFHTDWLNTAVMTSLDSGEIQATGNFSKLESARTMVAILSLARFAYILLLMGFFFIMVSFGTSLVFQNHNKGGEDSTASFVAQLLVASSLSTLLFWTMIYIMSEVLNGVLAFSNLIHGTSYMLDINMVNDTVSMFRIGLDSLTSDIGGS